MELVWFQSAILWEKFSGYFPLFIYYCYLLQLSGFHLRTCHMKRRMPRKRHPSCLDMIKYGISECKETAADKVPDTDLHRALHQGQIPSPK